MHLHCSRASYGHHDMWKIRKKNAAITQCLGSVTYSFQVGVFTLPIISTA